VYRIVVELCRDVDEAAEVKGVDASVFFFGGGGVYFVADWPVSSGTTSRHPLAVKVSVAGVRRLSVREERASFGLTPPGRPRGTVFREPRGTGGRTVGQGSVPAVHRSWGGEEGVRWGQGRFAGCC